jgi:hypothetical protein
MPGNVSRFVHEAELANQKPGVMRQSMRDDVVILYTLEGRIGVDERPVYTLYTVAMRRAGTTE